MLALIGYVVAAIISLLGMLFMPVHTDLALITGGREPTTQFQREVAKKYSKYKAPKIADTFEEFCFPRKYKIQRQQQLAADYMHGKRKEFLVFHKVGAGKTCLAIQIAKTYQKASKKPLFVMPAALIPGF